MPLLDTPKKEKKYTATLKDGVLHFRHPWVVDKDGHGIIIRRGLQRLTPTERGEVEEQVEKLLQQVPRDEKGLKGLELHPMLKTAYFKPIEYEDGPGLPLEVYTSATAQLTDKDGFVRIRKEYLDRQKSHILHWKGKFEKSEADNEQLREQLARINPNDAICLQQRTARHAQIVQK